MWARAATMAVAAAAGVVPSDEVLLDEDGLQWERHGSWWWRITLAPGGEAVFCGQDADGSDTHLWDEPIDLLAGLPSRLNWPGLRGELRDAMLGYVYWYTDGAWHRVSYPEGLEDDGLESSYDFLGSDEEVIDRLTEGIPDDAAAARAVAGFLAEARERRLAPGEVSALLCAVSPEAGLDPERCEAALETAARTGLLAGTTPPCVPTDSAELQ
ncbi:hypothetical protein DN402_02780 [Streptomyces sp. SW4]|nr:hypothetical protein DN402_02780 [Streptomyces sp. SW4]